MLLDSVILFNKSLDQRLSDFRSVLCSRETTVSANDVADEWSYYAELVIEPVGWQAVWKVCRRTCQHLYIDFPTYVIVYVESVDFKELCATVSVISVVGNISIPQKHEVPLKHIYPLKEQENSALNIEATADCIDQIRFFYNNVWQPWDLDDSDGVDWPSKYLEARLTLYFEMMNEEKFPQKLADRIYSKIVRAQQLYERMKDLEESLTDGEINGREFDENILSPTINNQGYELYKIHLELNPLKTEIQLLENPTMRTLIISQFLQEESESSKNYQYILVWEEGSIVNFETYFHNIKSIVEPTSVIRSAPSLEAAMDVASSGQVVLLHPGFHKFSGRVESNILLKGLGSDVYVKREESHSQFLNIRGRQVKLENLSVDVRNVENGILVPRNTNLQLYQCNIFGASIKKTVGVVVLSGGSVIIDKCQFRDLQIAIRCFGGSKVTITNSAILNCRDGLQANEKVNLDIQSSSVSMCANAGIVYDCHLKDDHKVGDISLLKDIKDVQIKDVILASNSYDVELRTLQS